MIRPLTTLPSVTLSHGKVLLHGVSHYLAILLLPLGGVCDEATATKGGEYRATSVARQVNLAAAKQRSAPADFEV
jgi:hypothetical protein